MKQSISCGLVVAMILCGAGARADDVARIDPPKPVDGAPLADVLCTRDRTHLYLRLRQWPASGEIVAPMKGWAKRVYMMGDKNKMLLMEATDSGLKITLPDKPSNPPVVVVSLDGEPELLVPVGEKLPGIPAGTDGTLRLMAVDAELKGEGLKLERKGEGDENIGFWSDVKAYVQWTGITERTGEYTVLVDYAVEDGMAGSEMEVVIEGADGPAPRFRVEGTGGWDRFKEITVGKVTLSKKGTLKLQLKSRTNAKGAVINLRRLELRPVAN